jgi:hypothetical protein
LNADSKNIYSFEGEDYKKFKNIEEDNNNYLMALDIGQRERKTLNAIPDEKR